MFDAFVRQKRWKLPLGFFLILGVSGLICLTFVGQRENALLLSIVLLSVAVLLPLAYFLSYGISVYEQCKTLQLFRSREIYKLGITPQALEVTLTGQTKTQSFPWKKLFHAYRTKYAIYLYVTQVNAFIIPMGTATPELWSRIQTLVPPEKCSTH